VIAYSHHSFTALLILILKLEFRRQPNCEWKVTSIKTPGSRYNRRSDTHNLHAGKHHSLLCIRTRAVLSAQPVVADDMYSGINFGERQNKQQQHTTEHANLHSHQYDYLKIQI
jgi:hypothetical protein